MATKHLRGTYNAGYTLSHAYSLLKIADTAVIRGSGVFAGALAKVSNRGLVLAGAGGDGGASHFNGRAGETGIELSKGDRVVNFGTTAGGRGGAGFGVHGGGYAGDGGAGGVAVLLGALGSVTNRNLIVGGDGGARGAAARAHQGAGAPGARAAPEFR